VVGTVVVVGLGVVVAVVGIGRDGAVAASVHFDFEPLEADAFEVGVVVTCAEVDVVASPCADCDSSVVATVGFVAVNAPGRRRLGCDPAGVVGVVGGSASHWNYACPAVAVAVAACYVRACACHCCQPCQALRLLARAGRADVTVVVVGCSRNAFGTEPDRLDRGLIGCLGLLDHPDQHCPVRVHCSTPSSHCPRGLWAEPVRSRRVPP